MPQINEYLPQTEAQGAVGGVTPNLEAVSLFGRGIEHVGASLEQASDVVHRRQAQEEVSQVYGQFAQARADWNTKLKQRLKDGSLDPDQFDQEYANYVNQAGDNLKTAEGKDFFNRQANRLGGTLMQSAITGKAHIAGIQAVDQISQGVQMHSANLMANPDQLPDAMDATEELIQAKQKDGTINADQAIGLRKQMFSELAKGSARGWAMQDPGNDTSGAPNQNRATAILDKGGFDDYLNTDQKAEMYSYANRQDSLRRIAQDQTEVNAKRKLEADGEDWMNQPDNAKAILHGTMQPQAIDKMPGTIQQKSWALARLKSALKETSSTDTAFYNALDKKIFAGDFPTQKDLTDAVNNGDLDPDDARRLQRNMNSSSEGVQLRNAQRDISKEAEEAVGLKFKGGVGGAPPPAAHDRLFQLKQEMDASAQAYVQRGQGTMLQYYNDRSSKDPGSVNQIFNKYRKSLIDLSRESSDSLLGNSPSAGTVTYSNNPTGQPPAPPPPPAPPAGGFKPGESIADGLKRMEKEKAAPAAAPAAIPPVIAPPPAPRGTNNAPPTDLERAASAFKQSPEDIANAAKIQAIKDKEKKKADRLKAEEGFNE